MTNRVHTSNVTIDGHQRRMREILETLPTQNQSAEFARALVDNSHWEVEWLWVASQVSSPLEAEYSYRKALVIWPESQGAKQGLAALQSTAGGNGASTPSITSGRMGGLGQQVRSA